MAVRAHLVKGDGHRFYAQSFSHHIIGKSRPLSHTDRHATLQVGECEIGRAVAAILRPEQREQCSVLRDRQNLTVAYGPANRREIEAEAANLAKKLIGHPAPNPPPTMRSRY